MRAGAGALEKVRKLLKSVLHMRLASDRGWSGPIRLHELEHDVHRDQSARLHFEDPD